MSVSLGKILKSQFASLNVGRGECYNLSIDGVCAFPVVNRPR